MKITAVMGAALLLLAVTALAVSAEPAGGKTNILGPQGCPSGNPCDGHAHQYTPTDVDVSIVGGAPIVPYEYSIENRCWFSGKPSGPSDSYERFDLAGPWFDVGGAPHT